MKKLGVEFYSGTQGISNAMRKKGWKMLAIELNPTFAKPPYNLDQWTISIADVTVKEIVKRLGGFPSFVWASPLCTTHSIAAISTHRKALGGIGKTQKEQKNSNTLIAKVTKLSYMINYF